MIILLAISLLLVILAPVVVYRYWQKGYHRGLEDREIIEFLNRHAQAVAELPEPAVPNYLFRSPCRLEKVSTIQDETIKLDSDTLDRLNSGDSDTQDMPQVFKDYFENEGKD